MQVLLHLFSNYFGGGGKSLGSLPIFTLKLRAVAKAPVHMLPAAFLGEVTLEAKTRECKTLLEH